MTIDDAGDNVSKGQRRKVTATEHAGQRSLIFFELGFDALDLLWPGCRRGIEQHTIFAHEAGGGAFIPPWRPSVGDGAPWNQLSWKPSKGLPDQGVQHGKSVADLYTTHAEVIESARTFLTEERAAEYTPIRYGDVLFAASGEKIDEIGKSAVNLIRGDARCGGDLIVLRPSVAMVPRFLGYAADASPSVAQKTSMGRGTTVKHIYPDELRNLSVAVPPIPEQQAIADFLDRKTAAIDELIAKKERLVALIAEKRQAFITETVTKGLNPNAPLKESGLPWVGSIPAHWTVCRAKDVVLALGGIQLGPFGAQLKELRQYDTGFKLYGQENTISGKFNSGSRWLTRDDYDRLEQYRLVPGDVVLTRKGASIGNCRLVPGGIQTGCIDSDTIRVRFDKALMVPELAVLLMHEGYLEEEIQYSRRGSVLPGLNSRTIANLRIACPPLVEQHEILRVASERLQRLVREKEAVVGSLAKLREYRQSIITSAVTGQLNIDHTGGETGRSPEAQMAEDGA